ncbi:MAG: hypothetical protein ACP5GJ_00455 [Nanopusillaceae archaeon]|jgi:hypothetical protein
MDWKDNLDPVFKDFLKSLIEETKKYKDIYMKTDDPGRVQIWIALGLIYRKLLYLESKISEIESLLNNKDIKEKLEEYLKKL